MTSGIGKSAPVVVGGAVSGMSIFGVSLPDFVSLLTCVYLIVMIGHTGWKIWGSSKDEIETDPYCPHWAYFNPFKGSGLEK